jgi:hypothetical protein
VRESVAGAAYSEGIGKVPMSSPAQKKGLAAKAAVDDASLMEYQNRKQVSAKASGNNGID